MVVDYKKVTQTLNYFATKSDSHTLNKMKALKLIWLADRYHLRKYGRPVTCDQYLAMQNGPVPSLSRDIAEKNPIKLSTEELMYISKYLDKVGKYDFKSNLDVNYDYFSDTDLEALKFACDNYSHFEKYTLRDLTHKYPEWKKHEDKIKAGLKSVPMDYIDFFDNPSDVPSDKFAEDQALIEANKTAFIEEKNLIDFI